MYSCWNQQGKIILLSGIQIILNT